MYGYRSQLLVDRIGMWINLEEYVDPPHFDDFFWPSYKFDFKLKKRGMLNINERNYTCLEFNLSRNRKEDLPVSPPSCHHLLTHLLSTKLPA